MCKINKDNDNYSEQNLENNPSTEEKRNLIINKKLDNYYFPVSNEQSISNISRALESFGKNLEIVLNSLSETFVRSGQIIVDSMSVVLKRLDNYLSSEFLTDLYRLFVKLPGAVEKLNKELLDTLYDVKWFEGCIVYIGVNNIEDYFYILEHTRNGSKNRTKQIDRLIFSHIDNQKVDEIRKSWRNHGLDTYILRICNQAVYAYERKEYALTIITLSSLWQGIIADKSNHTYEYRKDDKTRDDFKNLSSETELYSRAYDFFKNYIMYPCASKDDVIDDVPGRHSSLHSWYTRYPSKKAALNAILFTDYLVKLNPVQTN